MAAADGVGDLIEELGALERPGDHRGALEELVALARAACAAHALAAPAED